MIDAAALLSQWLSPGYPVGAFAYSHGFEQAIADGEIADAASLRAWLGDVVARGGGRTDAILLRAAHAADAEGIARVDAAARAWAGAAERRHETDRQGAAFARTTAAIWGLDLPACTYPVAVGRAAGLFGLPVDLAVRLYLQAFAANLVSAAVRLVPLGQTEGQAVLADLAGTCSETATATSGAGIDDLAQSAFAAEIAAMRHETLAPRIFRT